jgi:hypothetical protein
MVKKVSGDQSYVSYVLMKNKLNLKDQMPQSVPKKQAERMLSRSNNILEEVDIGCNVLIPIPQVDRGLTL